MYTREFCRSCEILIAYGVGGGGRYALVCFIRIDVENGFWPDVDEERRRPL